MKGTKVLERKIGTVPFVASSEQKFDLKLRPNLLKRLQLRLSLTNTVAGAGGNAVQDNPMSLVQAVRVETTEGKTLKNLSATELYHFNKLEMGSAPYISGQLSGAIVAGTYNQKQNIVVPFEELGVPERTMLNSNSYAELTLIVRYGSAVNIVDANNTLSNVVLDVIAFEREPVNDTDRLTKRPEMIDTVKEIVNTGAGEFEMDIPENTEIKSILIKAINNGVRSDSIITNVKVQGNNGTRVVRNMPFDAVQMSNKEAYGVETIETGIALLEFDPDGDLRELLSTIEMSTPQLVLTFGTPTGVSKAVVVFRQIVS